MWSMVVLGASRIATCVDIVVLFIMAEARWVVTCRNMAKSSLVRVSSRVCVLSSGSISGALDKRALRAGSSAFFDRVSMTRGFWDMVQVLGHRDKISWGFAQFTSGLWAFSQSVPRM